MGAGILLIFKVEREVLLPTAEKEKKSQVEAGRSRELRGYRIVTLGQGEHRLQRAVRKLAPAAQGRVTPEGEGKRGCRHALLVQQGARDRPPVQPLP